MEKECSIPNFIADCHLGKLAKYLRLLGYDTLYFSHIDDDDLIVKAADDQRIILTRDRELYERSKARCIFLNATKTYDQLLELLTYLNIKTFPAAFTRCLICNNALVPVDKQTIFQKIPKQSLQHFSSFTYCQHCDKVYWHGSHYQRMKSFISQLRQKLNATFNANEAPMG